jgi:hypothetical protein
MPMDNSAELHIPRLTPDQVGSVVSVMVFNSIVLNIEQIVALSEGQPRTILQVTIQEVLTGYSVRRRYGCPTVFSAIAELETSRSVAQPCRSRQ